MSRKKSLVILILSLLGVAFLADFALAQNFGINEINSGLNGALASFDDPRVVAARFIQLALGFLGVLAVLLVMYAGFIWMTSAGSEDKIAKAKKLLLNGVMGLIIILSAWAITTFLLNKITNTLNGGSGTNNGGDIERPRITTGAGSIGACSVQNVYPSDGQSDVSRNTSIMITFKEELDLSSVCLNESGDECACDNASCNKINPENIRIFKDDLGDACANGGCPDVNTNLTNAMVSVPSDKKTLIIIPGEYLGSASGNTPYSVIFNDSIKKANGSSVFDGCGSRYLQFSFKVSNQLDLEPPLVLKNSIFPLPDNEKDLYNQSLAAKPAVAEITVNNCPQVYSAARVISVSEGASATLDYKGQISKFKVAVPAETPDKAQLFNGENGAILGIASFDENKKVVFPDYFSLEVDNYSAGSFWDVIIAPERLADTLRVNSSVYTFADSSVNNNIKVNSNCDSGVSGLAAQAANIQAVLSGHNDVTAQLSGNKIILTAKVAGAGGNGMALSSSNQSALSVTSFSSGVNKVNLSEAKDKEDRPRNSAIQLNFNEAVNPLTVSGSASEVSPFIRIVNYDINAKAANATCTSNAGCLSYKCDNSVCVGDYLDGKFTISNNYRTLEFISNEECGKNACGETIYCLPANSHLKIQMQAANLKSCASDADCAAMNPFKSCSENAALGYKTCQNPDKKNYPTANIGALDGIVDAAANSLDGNRSSYASGPIDFYNENTATNDKEDSYTWSFYVSDEIKLSPPQITSISPSNNQEKVSPADEIVIHFNTLMLNSTLVTGNADISNGKISYNHKFINLRSSSPAAYGFWIDNDNIDIAPFDGEPDLTISRIKHTPFPESLSFYAQVGSGVKDIYQNCFKPSIGPDCPGASASCCFGLETDELDADGNCLK